MPILKILWTKEQIDFLREKYVDTMITKEKLRKMFNKRFKMDRTLGALSSVLSKSRIKKSEECRRDIIVKNTQRGIKKRMKEAKKFKKKIIKFMIKQSKIGGTSRETWSRAQIYFESPITIAYFRKIAQDNKIKFMLPRTKQFINDLDPKIFKNKELEKYLISQADIERPFYVIESEIIEFFEFRLTTTQIRKYCILKGIETKWI